jgi:hypothetical protein
MDQKIMGYGSTLVVDPTVKHAECQTRYITAVFLESSNGKQILHQLSICIEILD